jgi:hypothetical protein
MRILRTVVHQQEYLRGTDGIGQQVEQLLGLLVDPVEVFKNDYERLVEALAQHDAFDCLQRAPRLDLPIHLRQRIVTIDDSKQAEQVGQRVFQTSIEDRDLTRDLLAALAFIVRRRNVEIIAEQINYRQIGRRLAM